MLWLPAWHPIESYVVNFVFACVKHWKKMFVESVSSMDKVFGESWTNFLVSLSEQLWQASFEEQMSAMYHFFFIWRSF
jgi:hypothetical protein